jgi:hypothetical protein
MTVTERLTSHWAAGKSSGVVFPAFSQRDYSREDYFVPHGRALTHDWIIVVPSIGNETMSRSVIEFSFPGITEVFVPRTSLGKRLVALRRKAIQAGMKLLTEDEVLEEVRRRRGELEDDEADLY